MNVLVVTGSPDDRASTENLGFVVDELARRDGVRVEMWYLRSAAHQQPRDGARVVDDLRKAPLAFVLEAIGLRPAAAFLRGRRLRSWLRAADPDVVVLDDGLGDRVLTTLRRPPTIVVRHNDEPPEHGHLEPPPRAAADLVLESPALAAARRDDTPDSTPHAIEYRYRPPYPYHAGQRFADPAERAAVRRASGLPTDSPLIVGWGDDGWLDGPELFIRALWALERRHGVEAHGVWFGLSSDPREVERLRQEARRCGVADRFHHRPQDRIDGRLCGDAVFLSYRSDTSAEDVREATCTGAVVVAFEAALVQDEHVRIVPDLDVERAAELLAEGLASSPDDRRDRSSRARRRFEPGPVADDVLAATRPRP